ncbi:cytochrome c biogenesis protein CcsA [Mangrovivirga sp. M17]|uniref:Cytochrome c biogenesis protein CcsA n=1 Tax=Mangrovivirga halotolerans TaxID=2993936 RepID=A0ABT3RS44_9BACT|nr:cytochrome c biogenesis protein CcsA [Mangrovivirga halotolerans]MCX2744604.1 cytochrome c biogenesis protein CcsA [Mangrovivirga halotolerans]
MILSLVHKWIGDTGHLFVIISFVTALASSWAYYNAYRKANTIEASSALKYARILFAIHGLAVFGIVVTLFSIIYNNYFEYHYAWSHSSRHLPVHYMISSFWEGQEGSFLLWIFWHVVTAMFIMGKGGEWEAPVMTVFSVVQAFLTSMVLGVVLPGIELKLGSSPFMLLRDVIDDPTFISNPNFVPEDGRGLNPLLQNIWMVIHPPTLFFGFALTLVPFSFMISGLWTRKYKEWVKPALPWTLLAAGVLGVGILMGAYWAYETLNFGGYWNWDPVENAVYIPWLFLVASYHVMIVFTRSKSGLMASMIMVLSMYTLILYSTFLTRSGVLGESSVHSFTDLGLSGQLLIYLLFFFIGGVALLIYHGRRIPSSQKDVETYSGEFWVFIGALILILMGIQVLLPTSIPVYNKIVEFFGGISTAAAPSDPAEYSKYQIWFAILLTITSGIAQYFWWKNIKKGKALASFVPSIILTMVLVLIILQIGFTYSDFRLIIMLIAGVFSLLANGQILIELLRKKPVLSGGAITHIGVAFMVIGILYSTGFSNVVSENTSGLVINKNMTTQENRENLVLWFDETSKMAEYDLNYLGRHVKLDENGEYVRISDVLPTDDPYKVVASRDIYNEENELIAGKADTFSLNPENTYYKIRHVRGDEIIDMYPRVQDNPDMGKVVSPDLLHTFTRDFYTYATVIPPSDDELKWVAGDTMVISVGEEFFINDYVTTLKEVVKLDAEELEFRGLNKNDLALKAAFEIKSQSLTHYVEPLIVIRDDMGASLEDELIELGIKVQFLGVDPNTEKFKFIPYTTQKDFVVIKSIEKPWINLLWLGTIILAVGFGISTYRRFKESAKKAA